MSNASSKHKAKKDLPAEKKPADVPGPISPIIVTVLAFFGAQFMSAALLFVTVGMIGLGDSWLGSTSGQFVYVLLSDIFILLIIWAFLKHMKVGLHQIGFGRRPAWKDLGLALVGYGVYFIALIAVTTIVGSLTQVNLEQKQELGFEQLFGTKEKIMALVGLVVLPPLVEEFIFRGFVFTGLRKRLTFIWATIITSTLFALPHLAASSEGPLWIAGIDTLVLSFTLCYLRETTGALWAPIALHAVKNAIAYAYLLSSVT